MASYFRWANSQLAALENKEPPLWFIVFKRPFLWFLRISYQKFDRRGEIERRAKKPMRKVSH